MTAPSVLIIASQSHAVPAVAARHRRTLTVKQLACLSWLGRWREAQRLERSLSPTNGQD